MYKKKDSGGKLALKEASRVFKHRWWFKKKNSRRQLVDENEWAFTTLLKEKCPKSLQEREALGDRTLCSSVVDDANKTRGKSWWEVLVWKMNDSLKQSLLCFSQVMKIIIQSFCIWLKEALSRCFSGLLAAIWRTLGQETDTRDWRMFVRKWLLLLLLLLI